MKTSKFNVKGMHCRSCEMLIIDSVEDIKGVRDVKASHKEESVIVEYDEDKVNDKMIAEKIVEEGYKVS